MGQSVATIAYRALTCPARMTPDFIVIGAHRGGTSSFYYHLTEHPGVAAATTKEVNFFDRNYHKGSWWYRAHFPLLAQRRYAQARGRSALITGEASPYYLFHPLVPQRVVTTLPQVKLIALLRNPIERAFSQHTRYVGLGWETQTFEEAIAREERERAAGSGDVVGRTSYLARGLYAEQLRQWLRVFPRERMLLLRSEDFYADPAAVLRQALAFLDMPLADLPSKPTYAHYDGYGEGVSRGEAPLAPATRQRLQEYFAPHNARLYDLLGRDMEWD